MPQIAPRAAQSAVRAAPQVSGRFNGDCQGRAVDLDARRWPSDDHAAIGDRVVHAPLEHRTGRVVRLRATQRREVELAAIGGDLWPAQTDQPQAVFFLEGGVGDEDQVEADQPAPVGGLLRPSRGGQTGPAAHVLEARREEC